MRKIQSLHNLSMEIDQEAMNMTDVDQEAEATTDQTTTSITTVSTDIDMEVKITDSIEVLAEIEHQRQ